MCKKYGTKPYDDNAVSFFFANMWTTGKFLSIREHHFLFNQKCH